MQKENLRIHLETKLNAITRKAGPSDSVAILQILAINRTDFFTFKEGCFLLFFEKWLLGAMPNSGESILGRYL